jgi:hypothetical protein
MANPQAYYGFQPLRHRGGGVVRASEYRILSAYNTAIRRGDPVKLLDDGSIGLAAAGDRAIGIFQGCQWTDTDGTPQFNPMWIASRATLGSAPAKAFVFDDKNISFKVRSGGTIAVSSIGNLADHVAGTGNDALGRSGAYLSGTMANTAASYLIIDIIPAAENEIGAYSEVEVVIYEHEMSVDEPSTPGV